MPTLEETSASAIDVGGSDELPPLKVLEEQMARRREDAELFNTLAPYAAGESDAVPAHPQVADGRMECPDCLELIKIGARVCRFCGLELDAQGRTNSGRVAKIRSGRQQAPQRRASSSNRLMALQAPRRRSFPLVVLTVVSAAAVAGVLLAVLSSDDKQKEVATKSEDPTPPKLVEDDDETSARTMATPVKTERPEPKRPGLSKFILEPDHPPSPLPPPPTKTVEKTQFKTAVKSVAKTTAVHKAPKKTDSSETQKKTQKKTGTTREEKRTLLLARRLATKWLSNRSPKRLICDKCEFQLVYRCTRCKGTGEVRGTDQYARPVLLTCFKCNGVGRLKCTSCFSGYKKDSFRTAFWYLLPLAYRRGRKAKDFYLGVMTGRELSDYIGPGLIVTAYSIKDVTLTKRGAAVSVDAVWTHLREGYSTRRPTGRYTKRAEMVFHLLRYKHDIYLDPETPSEMLNETDATEPR